MAGASTLGLVAVRSVASCLFRRGRERPGTALRSLCVAAFDFTARACGHQLDSQRRQALSCLLDLGALINDHFDQHRFCKLTYRKLRKEIAANKRARAVYRVYFRELRQAERNRPRFWLSSREGTAREIADYREKVVRLSLSALASIAFGRPTAADGDRGQGAAVEEACLPQFFALVMLIQICDDILDWRKDWRAGLPTLVTAELLREAAQAEKDRADSWQTPANVERMAAAYLLAASRWRCVFWPIASCTYAAFLIARLLSALILRSRAGREAIGNARLGGLHVSPRCRTIGVAKTSAFSLED
jgi:hypothetical protein